MRRAERWQTALYNNELYRVTAYHRHKGGNWYDLKHHYTHNNVQFVPASELSELRVTTLKTVTINEHTIPEGEVLTVKSLVFSNQNEDVGAYCHWKRNQVFLKWQEYSLPDMKAGAA